MQITTQELRHAVEVLLNYLEDTGHTVLTIERDHYWWVSADQRYDPHRQPNELTLGQLTDDWAEITKIVTGESAPIGYSLVWLSTILCAIGEDTAA